MTTTTSAAVPSGRLVRGLPDLDKIDYKGTTTRAAVHSGRLVRGLPDRTKLTIRLTITTSQVQLYLQEDLSVAFLVGQNEL